MTNSFFAPVAAPRSPFALRFAESFLVVLAAGVMFAATWFARYFVMLEASMLMPPERHGPILLAFAQTVFPAAYVVALMTALLVIVNALWWIGIGVAILALSSLPVLQCRPRVLRAVSIAVIATSAVAGFFATLSGGPGGAFIG